MLWNSRGIVHMLPLLLQSNQIGSGYMQSFREIRLEGPSSNVSTCCNDFNYSFIMGIWFICLSVYSKYSYFCCKRWCIYFTCWLHIKKFRNILLFLFWNSLDKCLSRSIINICYCFMLLYVVLHKRAIRFIRFTCNYRILQIL